MPLLPDDTENIDPNIASKFLDKARQKFEDGDYEICLKYLKQANSLSPSEKIQRKMRRIEQFIEENQKNALKPTENQNVKISGENSLSMPEEIWGKLYKHQQEGVCWLWSIHKMDNDVGGILADDMGLGKTIQVVVFISELINQDLIKNCLIVLPVALISNWTKEFEKWAPTMRVLPYHGSKAAEKRRNLSKVHKRGGILMTSYGILVNDFELFGEVNWDYVILDEGHKIKNPSTKCAKAAQSLNSNRRLLLTGTAVQNNLDELWALFDYTHQGTLLGSKTTFKVEYANPINNGRMKDATTAEQNYGLRMSHSLKKIIDPYFLRRTKAQVKSAEESRDPSVSTEKEKVMKMPSMTRKNDLVVWVYLSPIQERIYRDFLNLDDVKQLLTSSVKRSPLMELTILKKICDHPRLMSLNQCDLLGLVTHREFDNPHDECAANQIHNVNDEVLMEESGKLPFLIGLVNNFKECGNRVLIFSQSRKILDIISQLFKNNGVRHLRLDGTVTKLIDRDEILARFSNNSKYTAMLLTTQVGGVGLTITAADRVIIYDPSWNPATDAQAVDRVFRIGQQKNVVVYRIITCGTVEEKIYRRQIFKDSITRQTTGVGGKTDNNPYRYFSHQDLKELFSLDDARRSTTQEQLAQLHLDQRLTDPELDDHIAFVHSLSMFGISDHDLMFSQAAEISAVMEEPETQLAEKRQIQAEQRLALESQENESEKSVRMMMTRLDLSGVQSDTSLANMSRNAKGSQKLPPEQRNPPPELFKPNPSYASVSNFKKPLLPKPSAQSRAHIDTFSFTFERPNPVTRMPTSIPPPPPPPRSSEEEKVIVVSDSEGDSSDEDVSQYAECDNAVRKRQSSPQSVPQSDDSHSSSNSSESDMYTPSNDRSVLSTADNAEFYTPAATTIDKKQQDGAENQIVVPFDLKDTSKGGEDSEILGHSLETEEQNVSVTEGGEDSEILGHSLETEEQNVSVTEGGEDSEILGDSLETEEQNVSVTEGGEDSEILGDSLETEEQNVSISEILSFDDKYRLTTTQDDVLGKTVESQRDNEEADEEDDDDEYDYEDEGSFIDLDEIDECNEDNLVKSLMETYNHSFQLEAQSPRPSNKFLALFDTNRASPRKSPTSSIIDSPPPCVRYTPQVGQKRTLVDETPPPSINRNRRKSQKGIDDEEDFDGMISVMPTP